MSVTLGNLGSTSIVGTASSTTLATKGLTAGNYINFGTSATDVTINANQYQTIDSVCIVSTASDTAVNNGASTNLSYGTEIIDPSGMHDTMTNPERVNILVAGYYLIVFSCSWSSDASTAGYLQHIPQFWDNSGSTFVLLSQITQPGIASTIQRMSCSGIYYLDVNDYVIVTATNQSGVNKNVRSGATLQVAKIGQS